MAKTPVKIIKLNRMLFCFYGRGEEAKNVSELSGLSLNR